MAGGKTLKSHRDAEGGKAYVLHALEGEPEPVDWAVAEYLQAQNLIDSNKKFPAATYWLTEKGREAIAGWGGTGAPNASP